MSDPSLLESLRTFFLGCPLLEGGVISVDRLDARGYALRVRDTDGDTLRRYLDGGRRRELHFEVCARAFYGADTNHLLRMRRLFDALEHWLGANAALPALSAGRRALALTCEGCARVREDGGEGAVWCLPCRLVYHQPKG